jgi:hypothetical protein
VFNDMGRYAFINLRYKFWFKVSRK